MALYIVMDIEDLPIADVRRCTAENTEDGVVLWANVGGLEIKVTGEDALKLQRLITRHHRENFDILWP